MTGCRGLLPALALLCLVVVGATAATGNGGPAASQRALQLDLKGAIGPAASDYVVRSLRRAEREGAALLVLRIDTPGGLDTSMREIVQAVLSAAVPVVGYVGPSGAHAASAGTFILYACHVAAMAPGTNLGAATPVQIGSPGQGPPRDPKDRGGEGGKGEPEGAKKSPPDIRDKAVSDAVAYIRSLAQMRGRNVEWAEKAVLEAASLSAEDALKAGVVDLIAPDVRTLLQQIEGREVSVLGQPRRLASAGVAVDTIEPDWRTKVLAVITDPNIASILMMIGIYGLIMEFYSPGLVAPGVIGAICLLLALYAFHVLPVNYSGVALIALGIALMVAEVFTPTFGILGFGGLVAFVIGSVLLIDAEVPGYQVAWQVVGGAALVFGGLFFAMVTVVARARRRPVVSGREQMIGATGPVLSWKGAEGTVRVLGESWRARAAVPLAAGMEVRVTAIDGLTLAVEPVTRGS
jgi:membrane-bound serine protease (ClpP class)